MATLVHGTTRARAERIAALGPDPDFVEPGGVGAAESFSTYLKQGPFLFGAPEEYARRKAQGFPNEGGPAILEVEVREEIIAIAVDDCFPLSQGLVQFDLGHGLEELQAAWSSLPKTIIAV